MSLNCIRSRGPPFCFISRFGQGLKAKGQELPNNVFTTICATSSVTRRIPTNGDGTAASGMRSKSRKISSPGSRSRGRFALSLLSAYLAPFALISALAFFHFGFFVTFGDSGNFFFALFASFAVEMFPQLPNRTVSALAL